MTIEEIRIKIDAAKAQREQSIAQVNAANGYIQALEEVLATMQAPMSVAVTEKAYQAEGVELHG